MTPAPLRPPGRVVQAREVVPGAPSRRGHVEHAPDRPDRVNVPRVFALVSGGEHELRGPPVPDATVIAGENVTAFAKRSGYDQVFRRAAGGNGVYTYGGSSTYPNQSANSANYWVDVVLSTTRPPGTGPSRKRWSAHVTRHSNALDLEPKVFTYSSSRRIALSLKRSAEASHRRKGTPYQSAMSMLNFYVNRAGTSLSAKQKKTLEQAKPELRKAFGRQ